MKPGPALKAPDTKAMAPSLVLICSLALPWVPLATVGNILTAKHVTNQMKVAKYKRDETARER